MENTSLLISEVDVDGLRRSGRIVSNVIQEMLNFVKAGITTQTLDDIAGNVLEKQDAQSAPKISGFPGNTCISVNSVIAHGVPNNRILQSGDRLNIDVSASHNGYFSDVAYTVIVGENSYHSNELLECAKYATLTAVNASFEGTQVNQIAKKIEKIAREKDFTIIRNLCSHGVGKSLHAYPTNILNYYDEEEDLILEEGMVIAWEPYLSTCATRAIESGENDWDLTTHNNSDVAQFEHTVMITKDGPEILTLFD